VDEHDEDTERSTARRRPGNDMLMEPSKRTLLIGVKTVGRGFGSRAIGE
jgi:hypothetical protein